MSAPSKVNTYLRKLFFFQTEDAWGSGVLVTNKHYTFIKKTRVLATSVAVVLEVEGEVC